MKNTSKILLTLILVIALCLRLSFTVISNEPFSVDSWPLIRIAGKIQENPNIPIWFDEAFDGYNNHWPGVILSSLITSVVTSIGLEEIYKFTYVMALNFSTLLLIYVILRNLLNSKSSAILSLLYFATIPSLLVFTSATLKEVYAYPLFYSIILLTILPRKGYWRPLIVLSILALSISMSHHLATVMCIGILLNTLVVLSIAKIIGSIQATSINERYLSAIITCTSIFFTLYYLVYGRYGFTIPFTLNDAYLYLIYTIVVYVSYILYLKIGMSKLVVGLSFSIIVLLVSLVPRTSLLPGFPALPWDTLLYAIPVILPFTCFLKIFRPKNIVEALIVGMLLVNVINILFISLAKPELNTVFHRLANYIILMNTMLIAYTWKQVKLSLRPLIALIPLITIISGAIVVYDIITGIDNISYYWFYRKSEVLGLNNVIALSTQEYIIGDAKIRYYTMLLENTSFIPLKTLMSKSTNLNNALVILYRDNYVKGYIISLIPYKINIINYIVSSSNRVYDNAYINAFTR